MQPDLFDPTTWGAPLPLGPWKKPTYVIEVREPTVADLLAGAWEPAPWPKGYACIYKATLIGTTRAYVGKTVDLRERFRGHMSGDMVIDRALKKHGPENFSIEVLRVFETEADAYAHEDSFIEAHRTNWKHGGFNIGEGGLGITSEEARKIGALSGTSEVMARRAGWPQKRVLAELEKGPGTIASMAASLGFTEMQIRDAVSGLRDLGHHIIRECGGLFRLVTFEEASDHWACGRVLRYIDRVLGALMEGPRTSSELLVALGVSCDSVNSYCQILRKNGYNIENRGAKSGHRGHPGIFHLIIDHKRHPWLHLGMMDLRGAAWDDREI